MQRSAPPTLVICKAVPLFAWEVKAAATATKWDPNRNGMHEGWGIRAPGGLYLHTQVMRIL